MKKETRNLRVVAEDLGRLFYYLKMAKQSEAYVMLEQIRSGVPPQQITLNVGAISSLQPTKIPNPAQDPLPQQGQTVTGGIWNDPFPLTEKMSRDDMVVPLLAAHEQSSLRSAVLARDHTDLMPRDFMGEQRQLQSTVQPNLSQVTTKR